MLFILSTHDTEILNTLGKYRSYLVNKTNNETAYELDEIPGIRLKLVDKYLQYTATEK